MYSKPSQDDLNQKDFSGRLRSFCSTYAPKALALTGILALAGTGFTCHQYADFPGFDESTEQGRSKNSIASLIAGIVGQKLWDNSNIDLTVEKILYPDAPVTGVTSANSIDSLVDLTFTSAHFSAERSEDGLMKGELDKSEFDWSVNQVSTNEWEVGRLGWKFDTKLILNVDNGTIKGQYLRPGLNWNWGIEGTYDQAGNIKIDVSCPWSLDFSLIGKITTKT